MYLAKELLKPRRVDEQKLLAGLMRNILERVHVALGHVYGSARSGLQADPVHKELKSTPLDQIDLILTRVNVGRRAGVRRDANVKKRRRTSGVRTRQQDRCLES